MKKIRLKANYGTSEELTERLLRQFKTEEVDLSDIEFVFDESYDTVIYFNYILGELPSDKKAFIFPHEPTWAGVHSKNFSQHPNATVLGFDCKLYRGNCVETVAHTFYGGRGHWIDKIDYWNYENLKQFSSSKTKGISSVITKLNNGRGVTCLYEDRVKIGKMLEEELPFIDMYGGWNSKFPQGEKKAAVGDYRFTIAIENEHMKNWITEKFFDCILHDTVPIYFGCSNIREIFPEDGYVLIEDIKDMNAIKKTLFDIRTNLDEIYESKLEGLRKIKSRYFTEFNLLKKIISLVS